MTEEQAVPSMVLPNEDGRIRHLALDVRAGRDGWNAQLSALYSKQLPTENFVTGPDGVRELTLDEVKNLGEGEHRFQGEEPHEVTMLAPRFDHLENLRQVDQEHVAGELPRVRAELAVLKSK